MKFIQLSFKQESAPVHGSIILTIQYFHERIVKEMNYVVWESLSKRIEIGVLVIYAILYS